MADEVDLTEVRRNAETLHDTLVHDLETRLTVVDQYLHGEQAGPYMPDTADAEYKLLAERCINNINPLLVRTPVQGCYVDGYRPGAKEAVKAGEIAHSPAWDWWQQAGLDAKQSDLYEAAIAYGHSFYLVERSEDGEVDGRRLSPLRTAAIYDDPANDDDPVSVFYVKRWPTSGDKGKDGVARLWDGPDEWEVTWKHKGIKEATYRLIGEHGAGTHPPVTRFAPSIDLDGRTTSLVWEMIPIQDRLNQTIFDLLIAQTGSSFNTRVFTNMAPPMQQKAKFEQVDDGNGGLMDGEFIGFEPVIGPDGSPVPLRFQLNGRQALFLDGDGGEGPGVGVHNLEGTPLEGYIRAIQEVKESVSSLTQTPPTYLLGQIANLSAEALNAAEISLTRKIQAYQKSFGESWERVFRLVAALQGDKARAKDRKGEVIWRDTGSAALSQTADALGKLNQNVGVPQRGLWARIPGVTQGELTQWEQWREEEDAELRKAEALERAVAPATPSSRPRTTQPAAGGSAK